MDGTLIVAQAEPHLEVTESQALDDFFKMAEFGFLGTQKFASCRRVEKQIPHFDSGPLRVSGRHNHRIHITTLCLHRPTGSAVIRAGGQIQAGHGTDTGQGLAAKAQGGHPFQVIQIMDFTGGMACDGQRQIVFFHPRAIVPNPDQLDATLLHFHIQAPGAGIQAVFQQFFDDGRRALHHFTGSDLVGESG